MPPAAGGEVEDLLEPVWSWPERTMLAFFIGEGMPGSRAAATPHVEAPRCVEPGATPPQALGPGPGTPVPSTPNPPPPRTWPPLRGNQPAPRLAGVKATAPPGWPPASPDPGSGDGARPHPGTRPAPRPHQPHKPSATT